ncbi:MAG: hypothetical protein WCV88_04165 [Patescibacteria group bacterium]
MLRYIIELLLVLVTILVAGCGELNCDPSLPGATCPEAETDTDSDTDADTDTETPAECWASVPFQIRDLQVDRKIARTVETDWDGGLDWVDIDPVFVLDGSKDSSPVTVTAPDGRRTREVYLPDSFAMRDTSDDLYNNGIVTALQPDGTVVEISYFDGSSGWVLPDSAPFSACEKGYDSTRWVGAHGGSHTTATQAVRVGELTQTGPIGRPLPIEVDHTHLSCGDGASSGYDCFTGPLAGSGDSYALSEYTGTIPELTMGSILVLPEGFKCSSLTTLPGKRLCEVARDHFFFVVDDSYGEGEVAFPVADGVREEVVKAEGIDLHNAGGNYAGDVETIMGSILVVANPTVAVK